MTDDWLALLGNWQLACAGILKPSRIYYYRGARYYIALLVNLTSAPLVIVSHAFTLPLIDNRHPRQPIVNRHTSSREDQ